MSRSEISRPLLAPIVTLLALLGLLLLGTPLIAQETAEAATDEVEEAAEPEPWWSGSAGLSFLATGGNTDTQTLGVELSAERRPAPWGLSVEARFDRAEEDDVRTAERYLLGFRGTRAICDRWDFFAGLKGEQDEFAGLDQRLLVEIGGAFKAISKPKHTLVGEIGLTWTDENRIAPAEDEDSIGALLGFTDTWKLSETSILEERLIFYPNFDDSDDWRIDYQIGLTAALTDRLAVKLGYELRYRNQPILGAEKDDSTTKVSLVASF